MDNSLLSDRSSLPQPFVPASPKGDGITLEAGQVHGMTEGSVFDVYPPGTKSFDDPSQATAQAELVTVGPYQSDSEAARGQADSAVVAGCRAATQLPGPQDPPAYRRRGGLGRPRQAPRGGRRRGPDRPAQPEVADLRPDLRGVRESGRRPAPAQGDEDQAGCQVDRPLGWGRDGAFAPGHRQRGGSH